MHKAKQIVDRLLGTDSERLNEAGNIKEFVARRQSGSKNMENRFALQNRAIAIAGELLEQHINPALASSRRVPTR